MLKEFDETQLMNILSLEMSGVEEFRIRVSPVMVEEWAKRLPPPENEPMTEFIRIVNDPLSLPEEMRKMSRKWFVGRFHGREMMVEFETHFLFHDLHLVEEFFEKALEVFEEHGLPHDELDVSMVEDIIMVRVWWD